MQVTDCPGAPKLDPRVRRTRKLLEDALRALMTERSYDDISVGDITERATVNRATFYAHFTDKKDLSANLLRGDLEAALLASLAEHVPLNAESLERVATAVFEFMARLLSQCPKHADEFTQHVGPTLQETIQSFLETWLKHAPKGMQTFPGANREAVTTGLAWSIYGGASRWSHLSPERRAPAAKAAHEIVALFMH